MDKFAEKLTWVLERIAAVLFILLFSVVLLNIVLRNVFGDAWLWIPGASRLLFIWTVFIGTTVLYQRHDHLVMDFFVMKMKPHRRARLELVINLAFLMFMVLLTIYGFMVVRVRMNISYETWNFPTGYAYLAVPVTAIIMALLCINKLRHYVRGEYDERGV